MAIKKEKVDVVMVGLGWTGAILGQELTEAGLQVLALERGAMRDTNSDTPYPKAVDELKYAVRGALFQDLSRETVTIRHGVNDIAVPYRQHGSFLLGNGVGGAGFHWNGMMYRNLPEELEMRTHHEQRYGKKFIPPEMTIQDHGVTYTELEPFYDFAEKVFGTSGKAGNIQGKIVAGGNPLEAARSSEFPLPPLTYNYGATLVEKAMREVGFNPYPTPAANASAPFTNPYGVRLGPCNYCGFCENFGCYMYSKASPQTTILPVLLKKKNFEVRPHSQVIKVNLDASGKKATGVTYIDAQGREIEQPADLVLLTAFQIHNVRLLLLSGIGKPYDPQTGEGVVGKNFAYQYNGGINVLMPKGTQFNPFVGTGAGGVGMDNLNADQFDHGPHGFIGGASVRHVRYGGRPIKQTVTVPGTPNWGSEWKAGVQDAYQRYLTIGMSGSVMAYRDAYLSLDPTYRDATGQPLLRMTFNWHENEHKMLEYVGNEMEKVGHAMNPEKVFKAVRKADAQYDVRPYQSTHLTGGAIMGTNPRNSVVNRYLQSWDVSNVFVYGASAFPQNMGYNPTGLVAALAYWSAKAIREQYLKNPGSAGSGIRKTNVIKHYFIAACTAALYFGAAGASAQTTDNQGQLIVKGEYLARAGDCIACHTAPGGKPFAGGLAMATPIGTVYSSNITPDKANGIGDYTEAEFDQALRHGIRKDGASLYPAMPYPSYAKVRPADVKALYAYFMHSVKPEPVANRKVDIPWPLSMRWPLSIWRMAFAPGVVGDDIVNPGNSAQIAQGRYLVEGLAHCSACHTPRGIGMQEKALTDDGSVFLSGGVVDGYLASNLRGDSKDGLGKWTEQDIVDFLKSGRNGHSAAFGGMADVVSNSTQHMTNDDLVAIAKYLKSLAPVNPGEAALVYDEKTHQALRKGTDQSNGAMTFLNNCAACHRSTGHGYDQTFPALALSPTVNAKDPSSLIRIALQGGTMPWTKSAPTQFAMPGFGDRLSDNDLADVLTYIRSNWGNNAPAVTADMVAKVRKQLPKPVAETASAAQP